jgi:uncharacterized protein YbjT (DUF2867 family)
VFVCGGTGTVGHSVLKQLHELYPNVAVKAQCRNLSKSQLISSCHPKAEIVQFDFDRVVPDHFRGCNSLFIMSPYTVDMLSQVRQLVDAAKESGVRHVVHLGVLQPEPSYQTQVNYIHWHRLCEAYIEASGLSFTHLRPAMFYSNLFDYSSWNPIQGNELHFPLQPQTKVGWVSDDDIGRIAAKSLVDFSVHSGQIYPITSAICSIQDVLHSLHSVPRLKDLKLKTISVDEAYQQLVSNGAEPIYMKGFRTTIMESNQMQDCSHIAGVKEGMEIVRKVGGMEPTNPQEWAIKHANNQ